MERTIKPLIDLADTDRDLMASIYSRSSLARKIDEARAIVDKQKKLIEEKNIELLTLNNESTELKSNIEIQEQLISKLDEQVPKIRNEKEFAASKTQLEEARKTLGILEDKMLELDIKKEGFDQEIEKINLELTESNKLFEEEASSLFKKHQKADRCISNFRRKHIYI